MLKLHARERMKVRFFNFRPSYQAPSFCLSYFWSKKLKNLKKLTQLFGSWSLITKSTSTTSRMRKLSHSNCSDSLALRINKFISIPRVREIFFVSDKKYSKNLSAVFFAPPSYPTHTLFQARKHFCSFFSLFREFLQKSGTLVETIVIRNGRPASGFQLISDHKSRPIVFALCFWNFAHFWTVFVRARRWLDTHWRADSRAETGQWATSAQFWRE